MKEVANTFTSNVGDEWEPQDSILQKKIVEMMLYAYQVLQNYPKAVKFSLAADMEHCMDTALELVIDADNKHYKKTTLQSLDTANKKLKKYVLLSFKLRFISPKQYKHWTAMLAEIGKIIGGRIAAAPNRP